MENKMREEFESWCMENNYTIRPAEKNCNIVIDGAYGHPKVQVAWEAWQASRAALVVELPSFENGSLRGYGGDCAEANMVIDSVAESLDAAGVSYK